MFSVAQQTQKFGTALDKSVTLIKSNLERTPQYINLQWSSRLEWTKLFVENIVLKFVFPILIVASVLIVIVWLYDIMFSGKEEIEKGAKYIAYGVIGIVIIQSAKFITSTYFGIVERVTPSNNATPSLTFSQTAYELYNQLVMPFIEVFMYAIIGILFVILLVHVIRFITSSEEDVAAKAKGVVVSNVVGIMVILLAKTMVETIYGKQADVVKATNPVNLWDVGSGILTGADFTVFFSIINYVLWFLGLIILIIIVLQTYQLLVNPTSDEMIKKIKTNMLYIVIWLAIIALAYVIVNFIIIQ